MELQSALGYRDTLLSTQLVTWEVQFISLNYVGNKTLHEVFEDETYNTLSINFSTVCFSSLCIILLSHLKYNIPVTPPSQKKKRKKKPLISCTFSLSIILICSPPTSVLEYW